MSKSVIIRFCHSRASGNPGLNRTTVNPGNMTIDRYYFVHVLNKRNSTLYIGVTNYCQRHYQRKTTEEMEGDMENRVDLKRKSDLVRSFP